MYVYEYAHNSGVVCRCVRTCMNMPVLLYMVLTYSYLYITLFVEVFTVCGVCTMRGLYVLVRVEPDEVHAA